jgi:hypothetical protein
MYCTQIAVGFKVPIHALLVAHKVTLLLMLKRRMNKNVMNLNNRAKAGKIQSA